MVGELTIENITLEVYCFSTDETLYCGPIPSEPFDTPWAEWMTEPADDPYIGEDGRLYYEGDGRWTLRVYVTKPYKHEE